MLGTDEFGGRRFADVSPIVVVAPTITVSYFNQNQISGLLFGFPLLPERRGIPTIQSIIMYGVNQYAGLRFGSPLMAELRTPVIRRVLTFDGQVFVNNLPTIGITRSTNVSGLVSVGS